VTELSGVFNVLVTPFGADDRIDVASLRRLVAFAIDRGAAGLTALGVNGEAGMLDPEERALVTSTVLDAAAGVVPVIVGASAPDSSVAAGRAAAALAAGAQGVMVALPPRAANAREHLSAIAVAAPGLDIVLQDYPASGHEPVTVEALAEICDLVPTVRAVKAEDPPVPAKIAALRRLAPSVSQLGGLGGVDLLGELRAGAAGTMTGFAFPEVLVAIVGAARAGDWDAAARTYDEARFALDWEAQAGIGLGLRKLLLAERGLIDDARTRVAMTLPADATRQARDVVATLTEQGVQT
jgi:4-hydroxy-tetrahydrodipicolinate synthase